MHSFKIVISLSHSMFGPFNSSLRCRYIYVYSKSLAISLKCLCTRYFFKHVKSPVYDVLGCEEVKVESVVCTWFILMKPCKSDCLFYLRFLASVLLESIENYEKKIGGSTGFTKLQWAKSILAARRSFLHRLKVAINRFQLAQKRAPCDKYRLNSWQFGDTFSIPHQLLPKKIVSWNRVR